MSLNFFTFALLHSIIHSCLTVTGKLLALLEKPRGILIIAAPRSTEVMRNRRQKLQQGNCSCLQMNKTTAACAKFEELPRNIITSSFSRRCTKYKKKLRTTY